MLVIDSSELRSFFLFLFRNIWQTAGKHDILESPGAVCSVGWPQKVSVAQVAEHHHTDFKRGKELQYLTKKRLVSLSVFIAVIVIELCKSKGNAEMQFYDVS